MKGQRVNKQDNERKAIDINLTYPEVFGFCQSVEVGLQLDGLFQALEEHLLEGDNLLNISEELLNVFSGQEGLLFQGLQVPLDQTRQVLKDKNITLSLLHLVSVSLFNCYYQNTYFQIVICNASSGQIGLFQDLGYCPTWKYNMLHMMVLSKDTPIPV